MLIYIITFLISLFLVYKAQLSKSIVLSLLFLLFGAAIPSFVAGVRDTSIGVDINVYAIPCYDLAMAQDFSDFSTLSIRWGVVFPLMIYLGYIMGSLSWGLGFVEFFICINVLIALYIQRRKMSMAVGYFLFLFLFYNMSLNLMRQSMALSCCVLAFSLMINAKYKISLIPLYLAFLSHSSVVMFSLLLMEFYFLVINKKKKGVYKTVFYIGLPLVVILYQKIMNLAIQWGVLTDHYEAYSEGGKTYFSYTNTLSQLCFLILMLLLANKNRMFKDLKPFSLVAIYSSLVLTTLSTINVWAFRAALYFEIIYLIIFPLAIKTTSNRLLVKSFYVFVVLFWFYDSIINGVNGTYPYTSEVLPSLF